MGCLRPTDMEERKDYVSNSVLVRAALLLVLTALFLAFLLDPDAFGTCPKKFIDGER